jgi:hypothetical protein
MPWFPGRRGPARRLVRDRHRRRPVREGRQAEARRRPPWPSTSSAGGRCRRPGPARRAARAPSRIHLFRVPAARYATRLVRPTDHRRRRDHPAPPPLRRRLALLPPRRRDIYPGTTRAGQARPRPPKPARARLSCRPSGSRASPRAPRGGRGLRRRRQRPGSCSTSCSTTGAPSAPTSPARGSPPWTRSARADEGSRHDAMTERTHHLVQLAASGHPGVAAAVLELRDAVGTGSPPARTARPSSSARCSPRPARPSPRSGPSRCRATRACSSPAAARCPRWPR